MNSLIAQLASRNLDVRNGRGLGSTGGKLYNFHFAYIAPVYGLLYSCVARIKSTVESKHDRNARRTNRAHSLFRFFIIQSDRFLAINRLSRFSRTLEIVDMRIGRRGN